jgi:hypothetical protein
MHQLCCVRSAADPNRDPVDRHPLQEMTTECADPWNFPACHRTLFVDEVLC